MPPVSTHSRAENSVVYAAGVAQGIVLVTIPAASAVFTSPAQYGLSSTQYGAMFLPQVVLAIAAALLGGGIASRFGTKQIYLAGLVASLVAMVLLLASQPFAHDQWFAYSLLLLATACLGVGFGLTVPALNSLTAAFHPAAVDASVLTLNVLLGLGTVLAPVSAAIFVGLGLWWGLPLLSAILLTALLLVSLRLPLRAGANPRSAKRPAGLRIPPRFWLYAGFAVLYGICETMNGNWSTLDMTKRLGASASVASLTLTAFWAMVTAGRMLFVAVQRWFPSRLAYQFLPFLLAAAFVAIALLPRGIPALGVLAFGLAGLGCSALLPLTISFAHEDLTTISASVAGGIIAFYQFGYGVAAFGAGPLQDASIGLPALYGLTAILALVLGGLSFAVAHGRPGPATLHPRPV
ncbi:MAG: MFS transporter [Candidatus Dormibacteraceae bacterium]